MKPFGVVCIGICSAGAAAGITWLIARKRYLKLADKEVESIKKTQESRLDWMCNLYGIDRKKVDENKQNITTRKSSITVTPTGSSANRLEQEELARGIKTPYNTISSNPNGEKTLPQNLTEVVRKPNPEDPVRRNRVNNVYLISEEEFNESINSYQTLHFYTEDGVISDDDDNRISNYEELVGPITLWCKFGKDDAVYVRNDITGIDYEIVKCIDKWESVATPTQKASALNDLGESDYDER